MQPVPVNDTTTQTRIKEVLSAHMREFDRENRGNRISRAIIEGLGMELENLVAHLIEEIKNDNNTC